MWQRGFLDQNTEFSEYEKIMSLIVILINVSSLFIKINMIIHWRSMYWKYYVYRTWYKHERKKIWIYIMCKLLLHIKRNFTWIVSIQLLARKGVAMMYDNLKSNKINNFFTVQILLFECCDDSCLTAVINLVLTMFWFGIYFCD